MFAVLRKSRKLQLRVPIDIQLQLFDSVVVPILLYGSEISDFENHDSLERLCLQFYKIILKAQPEDHGPVSLIWVLRIC